MALNLKRWLLILAVGCAGAAVALLPPVPPMTRNYRIPTTQRLREQYQVEALLQVARRELFRARLRQWVDERVAQETLAPGLPLVIGRNVSDTTRRLVGEKVASLWGKLGAPDPALRVAVVLVGDSAAKMQSAQFLLPPEAPDQSCIAVISPERYDGAGLRGANGEYRLQSEIGACLLFAKYGQPGPEVARWFRTGGLSYGTQVDLVPAPPEDFGGGTFRFESAVFGSWEVYSAGADARHCRMGDVTRCAKLIMEPDPLLQDSTRPFLEPGFSWRRRFGPGTAGYLSDLARSMGEERFSRFWTSGLAVEPAFQQAFGMSLGEWTQGWYTRRTPYFHPGPAPGTRSTAYAGGIVLLLVSVSLVLGHRRRMR